MRLGRTLAVLAALGAVLAGLLVLQRGEEERVAEAYDVALLPDLDPARVAGLEIEHVDNATFVALARDAEGAWSVLVPVTYPASPLVVGDVLSVLASSRGVAAAATDLAAAGLDPPAIVVRVELAGGGERRVEVGRPGAVGRVPAREATAGAAGPVVHVPARLATALARFPDDYRDPRLTALEPTEVVGLRRRGAVVLERGAAPVDVALDARLEETGWRSLFPRRAALDPVILGLLARGAATIEALDFRDEAPGDRARFGLDAPDLELEIEDARGGTTTLHFAGWEAPAEAVEDDLWYAAREGSEQVWMVEAEDVALLAQPFERLLDPLLVRVAREEVARIELASGPRELVLAREGESWSVAERRAGDAGDAPPPVPADAAAALDVLARLEHAQVREHRLDLAFPVFVTRPDSLALVTRSGVRLGGELAPAPAELGEGAALFRRFGDDVVGVVPASLAELVRTPLAALAARDLVALPEHEVAAITVARAGVERTFERDPATGVWLRRGGGEAREFALLLDRLLALRARRPLADAAPEAIEDGIEVRLSGTFGPARRLVLGRLPDGTPVAATEGRTAEVDPALHAALAELLR